MSEEKKLSLSWEEFQTVLKYRELRYLSEPSYRRELSEEIPNQFGQFPLEIRAFDFRMTRCKWSPFGIEIAAMVPERDTGRPIEIQFHKSWTSPIRDFEHLVYMVRSSITEFVAHELAEQMLIHGQRKDPHLHDVGR